MEETLRAFTKKAKGLFDKDYWTRLSIFKLNSIQRRVDRYRIIYAWKSLNGYCPNIGIKWNENITGRNGKILNIPKVKGVSQISKTLRRNSIQFYGVKLMNILPTEIRNFKGKPESETLEEGLK